MGNRRRPTGAERETPRAGGALEGHGLQDRKDVREAGAGGGGLGRLPRGEGPGAALRLNSGILHTRQRHILLCQSC